jgi:glutamate synthase (ferredoxin)
MFYTIDMVTTLMKQLPDHQQKGLYEPTTEHDACGVGFVVNMKGRQSHEIVSNALTILKNLLHRGACGCEENTGDGVGILIQMPHKFFQRECKKLRITLKEQGRYGAGMVFLPRDSEQIKQCQEIFEKIVIEEGQHVLGWRDVPTDDSMIGPTAKLGEPSFKQIFIGRDDDIEDADAFDRKLYIIRKRVENIIRNSNIAERDLFYIPSLSCKTFLYKGKI